MNNQELIIWREEKQIMDDWDIDADIKELESQLKILTPQMKIILDKLEDLDCWRSIKERLYSKDNPPEYKETLL